jgi:hypothetical protein
MCVVHKLLHAVHTTAISPLLISRHFTPVTVILVVFSVLSEPEKLCTGTRLRAGRPGLWFPPGRRIFLFSTPSTPALGSTQHTKCVPETLSPRCEAHHSLSTSTEVKTPRSYTSTWPYVLQYIYCSITQSEDTILILRGGTGCFDTNVIH